ncbi:DUF3331 domain-containing protein [Paraburkholderia sp. BR10937]|uniref:DUF3331 domain-containing protein n=1 Tax=Paraburkholderia sp. BR10937 TaxID=3236994 RepID=UPI0034D260F5
MISQCCTADPWAMTVGLLGQLSGAQLADCVLSSHARHMSRARHGIKEQFSGVTVHVIERSTATRITLAWRDPSRCAYGDQEWYLTRARRSGVCAVSGRPIRRGESVYRPRPMRPQALNADAMIHTAVFQDD